MFPSASISAVRQSSVSRGIFSPRRALSGWLLAAAAALIVCALPCLPLEAQTAHFGAVITLGSGFLTPTGVAVDGSGNVFVADNGNSAVKEIVAVNGQIPASPVILTLGSGFANPFTVAVDGSGNVYVADYGNHAVKEIEAVNGTIPPSPTIRTLSSAFGTIFGVAVDGHSDVFVTDYSVGKVKEMVAINGSIPASPKILSLGSGFSIPAGLAVDASGNVFVGDQDNNAAKEILASSSYTTTITLAAGFTTPDGIAVDQYGNVYVADDGGNTVNEILAVNGSIPVSPTILTLGSGFLQPFDVAVDGSGNVYVADRGNSAVKEIQGAGANFGQVNVGTTTLSPVTLYFTFDTSGTLGSTAVVTLGNAGMDFYDSGGGTCTPNTTYNAGDICTVNVKFGPLAPGMRYGAVELLSGGGALLASGPVQGIGVGPQATFATTTSGFSLPAMVIPVGNGFNSPGGVAVDANENVFVADSYNNAVKKVLASGAWSTVTNIGSGFSFPNGVALDGAGNVYVADTYNDAVKEIVAAGGYTTVNTLGSGFSNPYAVAVDGSGNVFVADFGNNAVKEIVAVAGSIPASPIIRTLASGLASGLNGPDGVAVDGNGNVFVANYGDGTIEEIEAFHGSVPASPILKTIASGFSGPSNLSVDGMGNLFVSDSGDNVVDEIVAAGGYTTVKLLGNGFNSPEAVAVSGSGNVLVASAGNNAVYLLDYVDPPTLNFAATPVGLTSGDSPQTVTVSNDGNAALIFPLPASGYNPSVPPNFAWDPSSTCLQTSTGSSQPFQLAGSASCTMALDFEPATTGFINGNIIMKDNNLNLTGTQAIYLTGAGNANAVLNSPIPGSVLAGPKVAFNWYAISGATAYNLRLGTTVGGNNLYDSGAITSTTVTPANLPTNGEMIYARLYTFYGSSKVYNDYVYTAATQAALTSPTSGTVLAGPNVTFTWSAAPQATAYKLWIGSSAGKNNLYTSGPITATSAAPTNLPTNGQAIYVTLVTDYGASQVSIAYTFTAASQAALTSPAPGTLAGPKVIFIWSAGTEATAYKLFIGTSAGASNLYSSGTITTTSATPASLPTNGEKLYVTLFTVYGASQVSTAYTFTAATQAALTAPTPGTVLAGAKVPFTWTASPEATAYKLWIGSSAGKNDLYSSGPITLTTATPTTLPTNGETVYVTLVTVYGSSQASSAYVFTAAP